jgi:hypothetical protein
MRYELSELYIALGQAYDEYRIGVISHDQYERISVAIYDIIAPIEVQLEIEREQQEYEIPTDQDWWEMIGC